ncbi:MAG TPA: FAD-binding oxidoreductase, partial [Thermomicrobiales bacterium]|nr:FAD-binding oxidoreductase [Thermomicrobiales bacterium]
MSSGQPEPPSYWQATAPPSPGGDALPATADVAVIGGGVLGSSAAYWLARAGARPALLEQEAIGYGATGRNGGFVGVGTAAYYPTVIEDFGHDAARAIWGITVENQALVRQVVAEEELDCQYREPGTLGLVLDEAELAGATRGVEALREDGHDVAILNRRQVQELVLTPLGPEIAAASWRPSGGLVHSGRYVRGIAGAAQRHGTRVCTGVRVTGLESRGAGVTIHTTRGDVAAGAVIVAVNAWTDTLVPALGGVITPVRGQMLAYAPLPPVFTTGLGASVTPTGEYWHQTVDGAIVLGGCRADATGRDVGVREGVPTDEVQSSLERVFPRLFPALAGLRVARRWGGLMAFTRDYLPVAGPAPDLPGVWLAGGFSGSGMPFGVRVGQLLAEAATTGVTPPALLPLRHDRPTL